MYVIIEIQLNIVFAILILNCFCNNFNKIYKIAIKYVLRYLKSSLYYNIIYKSNN